MSNLFLELNDFLIETNPLTFQFVIKSEGKRLQFGKQVDTAHLRLELIIKMLVIGEQIVFLPLILHANILQTPLQFLDLLLLGIEAPQQDLILGLLLQQG